MKRTPRARDRSTGRRPGGLRPTSATPQAEIAGLVEQRPGLLSAGSLSGLSGSSYLHDGGSEVDSLCLHRGHRRSVAWEKLRAHAEDDLDLDLASERLADQRS